MIEIKFTTNYEIPLSFEDENFKGKYEEKVGNNPLYRQIKNGETRRLALCPRCDNPVVILGVYKKIKERPHARHEKELSIEGISEYNEYKYLRCPYHKKNSNYTKEYVPQGETPKRKELYEIARKNFDKAIYLLGEATGIYYNLDMIRKLAINYVTERAYNYIDATIDNIPWFILYSYKGFPLQHMLVRKDSALYRKMREIGIPTKKSRKEGYVYVEESKGYVIKMTNYTYNVDKEYRINEKAHFAILEPDEDINETVLYKAKGRYKIKVDTNHYMNLLKYSKWKTNEKVMEIVKETMAEE